MDADENPVQLTKEKIHAALARLAEAFKQAGITGEICIYGGTAMVLAFDAREATRDIDAVFVPPTIFRELAAKIAEEMNLPSSWLNDGVKGFRSAKESIIEDGMPQFDNLRVTRPSAEYLLAMKCLAARVSGYDTAGDRADVEFLIRHLGLSKAGDILHIVESYYPADRISVKTRYFIEEIMADLSSSSSGQPGQNPIPPTTPNL
ncbi:MAG: hypothetical protein WCD79_15385 [Chthoniobacteraceae bacterium]